MPVVPPVNAPATTPEPGLGASAPSSSRGKRRWLAVAALVGLSLTLNLTGNRATLPSSSAWVNDTIAGINTVAHRKVLFSTWVNKYPRVHFLVNSVFYEPFIRYWQRHPVVGVDAQGAPTSTALDQDRMSLLCLVAFVITAAMGSGAVVAVFLAARLLWEDELSAFFAAGALACAHEFVFYAHSGNTDVPATFWFAWCVYFAIRIVRYGETRDYVLASLLAVLAVGSKDPTIGYLVGLALAVGSWQAGRAAAAGAAPLASLRAAASRQSLLAGGFFLLGFCVVNNIITDPQGYLRRMRYWQGTEITSYSLPPGFGSQLRLVADAFVDLHSGLGWPLLALAVGAIGHGLLRTPGRTAFCVAPLLSFYAIVIVSIRFTTPRFFMPGFVGLALIAGHGAATLLRSRRLPVALRWASVLLVFLATFLYGLGSSLEIARDSRVRAVEWFAEHVDRSTPVATFLIRWYSPYLPNAGFWNFAYPWKPPPAAVSPAPETLPPYIISGPSWQMGPAANRFVKAMTAGQLPYRKAAVFEQELFYPKKTIFGLAGWPVVRQRQSSPTITIWERTQAGDFPAAGEAPGRFPTTD